MGKCGEEMPQVNGVCAMGRVAGPVGGDGIGRGSFQGREGKGGERKGKLVENGGMVTAKNKCKEGERDEEEMMMGVEMPASSSSLPSFLPGQGPTNSAVLMSSL